LAVVWSLPMGHQTYLFEEVCRLCSGYLRRNRISDADVTPPELVSEVWKKLLGSVSLDTDPLPVVRADEWSADPNAPEHDGRVICRFRSIADSHSDASRTAFR
jgi:hypothetical protein